MRVFQFTPLLYFIPHDDPPTGPTLASIYYLALHINTSSASSFFFFFSPTALTFNLRCISLLNNHFCMIGVLPEQLFIPTGGIPPTAAWAFAWTSLQSCCKSVPYRAATFSDHQRLLMDSHSCERFFTFITLLQCVVLFSSVKLLGLLLLTIMSTLLLLLRWFLLSLCFYVNSFKTL